MMATEGCLSVEHSVNEDTEIQRRICVKVKNVLLKM
jgi:hypothetical protein